MKKLILGSPIDGNKLDWAVNSLRIIEQASFEDIEASIDGFTIEGAYTKTRSLTPSTASTSDLANFMATLIIDIKQRGQNRTE
tara:strand:+ start:6095 stop:6343 length:249 start_codon:yes stop_codon:yes gene_type:complete